MNFRKYLHISIVVLLFSTTANADWINDWAAQSTYGGPSYFEGQKRNFVTGGSYSARFRNSTESLFSIQSPRLKSGCGGIDLFMGGFSFMDPEYLMQKLQRALQAAPAIAFDLALKETCAECASTLGKFEGIINTLNQAQISECGMAQDIASLSASDQGFGQILSMLDSFNSADASADKGYYSSKENITGNDNRPTQEQSESVEGCSSEFKNTFTRNGSILEHIADSKGLGPYADFMRAYLGDVVIGYANNQFNNRSIPPCPNSEITDINAILNGTSQVRPITGGCVAVGDQAMSELVENRLSSISDSIVQRRSLSADELKFLNESPINVYSPLSYATKKGYVELYINNFKDIIAKEMTFAMIDDLVGRIGELTSVAKTQAETANSGANNKTCEIVVIAPVIKSIVSLSENAKVMKLAIDVAKREHIKEINERIKYADSLANPLNSNDQ